MKETRLVGKDGSTVIRHEDGSMALHTADGTWIDFASPKPSQLDRLAADAAATSALEKLQESRQSAPWYAPVIGVAIWIAALGALVAIFLLGLKWYLGSQGM